MVYENIQMDHNTDHPRDPTTTRSPEAFHEPLIGSSERRSCNVRDSNGELRFHQNAVLVSTGYSTPYNTLVDNTKCSSSIPQETKMTDNRQRRQTKESAYLIIKDDMTGEDDVISKSLFGSVVRGIVLRRSPTDGEWEKTTEYCAIKTYSWGKIRTRRNAGCQEDPQKESAVMQYLEHYFVGQSLVPVSAATAMHESGVIMPLDFLYDSQFLYTITPFCSDGELFSLLPYRNFTEEESRYLMKYILNGLESLQRAGICHLDISLENIMIHRGRTVLIDMGMSIKIPFVDSDEGKCADMSGTVVDHRDRSAQRCLIDTPTPAGKPYCKAPENNNEVPFDGHAVDMWAVGVCLFSMLTGRHPWTTAKKTDECFRHYSAGHLVNILTNEPSINLSGDAMDLLQRMMLADPMDRLGLQQVRAHPWMKGPVSNPTNNS